MEVFTLYSDTITLFNRYQSKLGDTWYPTVLHNVDLNVDKAAISAKYGENSADSAKLHIKYQRQGAGILVGGKPYLAPKEWDKQINDLLPATVTFTDGTDFDFFYTGDWGSEEPIADNDYTDGFYGYMNKNYDYVFAVSSVAMYTVIPHFEIMGK